MYSLLFLFFLHIVKCQIAAPAQDLKEILPVQNFQPARFVGKWYDIASYRNRFDTKDRCKVGDIEFQKESAKIVGKFTGFTIIDNAPVIALIEGHFVEKFDIGNFNFKLIESGYSVNLSIKVIATDYDNYSILWGCTQQGDFSERFSWLFGRKRHLPQEILDKALIEFSKYHLSIDNLVFMDQNNCNN